MIGDRVIERKPRLTYGDLNRSEQRGLTDKCDLGFEGETEIAEPLDHPVVPSDKSNNTFMAGLKGGKRDQGVVAG